MNPVPQLLQDANLANCESTQFSLMRPPSIETRNYNSGDEGGIGHWTPNSGSYPPWKLRKGYFCHALSGTSFSLSLNRRPLISSSMATVWTAAKVPTTPASVSLFKT